MARKALSCAMLIGGCFSSSVFAIDCTLIPDWKSDIFYPGGERVTQNETAYESRWWSRNESPSQNSGPWEVWKTIGDCATGDNALPDVALVSPLNNATLTAGKDIELVANASDSDGEVIEVKFTVNGNVVGTASGKDYRVSWTAVEGDFTITAVAVDNRLGESQSSVNVTVIASDENIPPIAQLTSPSADTRVAVGERVTLSASATDDDGVISQVAFFVNEQQVASVSSAPYASEWQAVAGTHTFRAKAIDNDGAQSWSQSVVLTIDGSDTGGKCSSIPTYQAGTAYALDDIVQNDNQKYRCEVAGWCSSPAGWAYEPGKGQYWQDAWSDLGICANQPEISFTSPSENTVLLAGADTELSVTVSDGSDPIKHVSFYADEQELGKDETAPYGLSWQVSGLGETILSAVAVDENGAEGEARVRVTVSDQPVVATLVSPVSGSRVSLGSNVSMRVDASSLTGDIDVVEFFVDGNLVASDNTAPFEGSWSPAAVGKYSISAKATDSNDLSAVTDSVNINVVEAKAVKHKLIGYWHNFVNGAGCPMNLSEMSDAWDVIDIAFAENDRNSDGTVHFTPFNGDIRSTCPVLDPERFKREMAELQAEGKIFVLSLGGAEGTITLNTDSDEVNFVSSLTALINEWGFDGLDIDLESGSNLLHGSQIQARLPRALLKIEENIGGNLYLTMAPEHPYVHGGMIAYSGIWGAYIPLIDQLRDTLDLLHVQLYNNGGLPNPYLTGAAREGTVDMMVAQSKMLIEGFELANGEMFKPLRSDQVAIGLPSGPSSANSGQAPIQNILDALDCVTKRSQCGEVVPEFDYSDFGGVMTWSINWDEHDGFNFSAPVGDKLRDMNKNQ
ncbi:Ig-like domain-containing protein [Veronia pacifica]|uniref:chitinase n=1 Tax=Veronia pacifica TaxID=1080227 RepID=A0A1C3EQW0_9GAMM|nr:Ig-like domain-containing protein [Veronia pacifica]ODA35635.1 chitinase [Veronia pacifica]